MDRPIDVQFHKKFIENIALLILKHIFPDEFLQLKMYDKPDLQDRERLVGVEVVEARSQQIARIEGEFLKMQFGKKSKEERLKCKQKIEINGGELDSISLSYPIRTAEDEKCLFQNTIRLKMEHLPSYRNEGFQRMGLFMFYNEPPIPFKPSELNKWFIDIQNEYQDKYDFLFFGYHCGGIFCDFAKSIYEVYTIDKNDFDEICKKAKMEVKINA